ncbi:hypothetical protein [Sphingorhabdus sp. Alg239-R122]|uniref:hypothetical protein n=1 Tax=Sphingorhabdus sp. Alg239-R122 TaxID=2305989 RepID=UPI0013DD30D4|nr:hypothetical protein [Sphingorhabdus sp. Alg239-R122]
MACAQEAQQEGIKTESESDGTDTIDDTGTIVVRAERLPGAVITPYEAVLELNPKDIASYGVSSVQDLLTALEPQTGGGRGRGSGRPVVLINSQPVSGFRELRNIPPEAIRQVQVLPEEVALQFGYSADQRVINFILVESFSSLVLELGHGLSTAGGYGVSEYEATYTKFGKGSRLNLNVEYEPRTALRESERGIVQSDIATGETLVGDISPQDVGAYRTLIAASDPVKANANYSMNLAPDTRLSFNAAYERNERRSLFGLNSAGLLVPASNPFARGTDDETIRIFTAEPRPLTRVARNDSLLGGFALNGNLSGWRWSLTGDASNVKQVTHTDTRADFAAIRAGLAETDPALAIDPFAGSDLGLLLPSASADLAQSETFTGSLLASISGVPLKLPAGEVRATFSAGYSTFSLDSEDSRSAGQTSLGRDQGRIAANIEVPLFERGYGAGKILGDVSLNGNLGYRELSDFGGLTKYGFGVTWKPLGGLSLSATSINTESAPSISQLVSPVIVTPNVPIFDLATGQNAIVNITTGGNPLLLAERQRDLKFALNYRPPKTGGLGFFAEYYRNRSFDDSAGFPALSPEIEAAFPGRVTRNGAGQLVALDRRPVTFDRVNSERVRYGISFSKSFGRPPQGRGRGRGPRSADNGGPPGTRPQQSGVAAAQPKPRQTPRQGKPGGEKAKAATADTASSPQKTPQQARGRPPAQSARRGRGGRRGFGGRRRGGRWSVYAFHNIAIDETILIRPGVPELDLLGGSATGSNGGASRHSVNFGGRWFNNGLGMRVSGNYRSGTRVEGADALGASDLIFDDIATVNVRFFFNMGSREKLVKKVPFLKGSRVSLRINNILGGIQTVRDESGETPLSYQPGFVDPRGRFVELNLRKRF